MPFLFRFSLFPLGVNDDPAGHDALTAIYGRRLEKKNRYRVVAGTSSTARCKDIGDRLVLKCLPRRQSGFRHGSKIVGLEKLTRDWMMRLRENCVRLYFDAKL